MDIIVTKESMDALQALADTNMKVSQAKAALAKLEEDETEYLLSREQRVVERLNRTLIQSETLVTETLNNYALVKSFADAVSHTADAVVAATQEIVRRDETFKDTINAFEAHCNTQEAKLAEQKKVIQSAHILLNSEKEGIERQKKLLSEKSRKIADERATLERAITRLTEQRI